jgi:hypothetical protein
MMVEMKKKQGCFVLFILTVLIGVIWIGNQLPDFQEWQKKNNAAAFSDVILQAAFDRADPKLVKMKEASSEGMPPGYPAESGAKSTHEYFALLVKTRYVAPIDLKNLGAGNMVLANVSADDPPETVLLVSRNYYDYMMNGGEKPRRYFIVQKRREAVGKAKPFTQEDLPPRSPQFLPP